jgi:hypothetical protein
MPDTQRTLKREWHGDSADDEADEEVGGTLAEPAGVA